MKIRILFTIPNFITAGSGREMFNIIERLDKNIFDVIIVTKREGGTLLEEIRSKGYTVVLHQYAVNKHSGILDLYKQARQLAKYYKQYNVDIWQSFSWSSDFSEALVARMSGAKYVYVKKNMNWDRAAWRLKTFLSSRIVARNTTMLRTLFNKPAYRSKTTFITGAVDADKFTTVKPQNRLIGGVQIPDGVNVVSCIAQIVKVKGQGNLIKAISGINDCYLFLAGASRDDEYESELKKLIVQLSLQDRVKLLGPVSYVNELLQCSDVFVLPTTKYGGHEEGCPVALLEAMATGIPCVASNVAGSNDLIINNETGLLYEPDDVNGLTSCIKKFIEDAPFAKQTAQNARKRVVANHTLDIEAKSFSDMYFKMVKR